MKANGAAGTGPIVWVATSGLITVVAVPFVFIVLQAIFPELGRSSLAAPFLHLPEILSDPKLLRMGGNSVILGICVMMAAALLAVPLAVFRALFKVPFAI